VKEQQKEKQKQQASQCADIISIIGELNNGKYVLECGRLLKELTESVKRNNKGGKMTILLEVKPEGYDETGAVNQVRIYPSVTLKEPQPSQGSSLFFLTDSGILTRDDPAQLAMFAEKEESK